MFVQRTKTPTKGDHLPTDTQDLSNNILNLIGFYQTEEEEEAVGNSLCRYSRISYRMTAFHRTQYCSWSPRVGEEFISGSENQIHERGCLRSCAVAFPIAYAPQKYQQQTEGINISGWLRKCYDVFSLNLNLSTGSFTACALAISWTIYTQSQYGSLMIRHITRHPAK